MANFLAPIINDQQENSNGAPLSGGTIEVYLAGSSTPATTYSDQAGSAPNTWPIVLNTLGVSNQGAVWLGGGFAYKFIIKDSTGVVQRTIDNVSGINDSTSTLDQWIPFATSPTYVSATSFTLAGDQRQTFQINRRVRTQNTSGFIYSTITNSAYVAPNTTVTVRNDSGVLDTGLSQVSYGIISIQNSSLTGLLLKIQRFTTPGAFTYTPTPGARMLIVELVGGGGSGGGAATTAAGQQSAGSGGGSGAYTKAFVTTVTSVGGVVGAGGGGATGVAGNPGLASSFGAITAPGGAGGSIAGSTASNIYIAGGLGAVAGVGGNVLQLEGATAPGLYIPAATAGLTAYGGQGAAGPFGLPGPNAGFGGPGNSAVANTGSGGSGAANGVGAGVAQLSGAGGSGVVIVYEYA